MPIWQLDPINPTGNNWRTSTYNCRVIIRALDELRARQIADLAFEIVPEHIPSVATPLQTWLDDSFVECQKIEAGPYEEEGAEK